MNLKDQLTKLLKKNGMNITSLSKEVQVPKSTISDWLAGSSPKNIAQVKKIADYFEVSLDYLCFGAKQQELGEYSDEINAGVFEVVLRRIKK